MEHERATAVRAIRSTYKGFEKCCSSERKTTTQNAGRNETNPISVLQEAEAELQAGLTGADDCDVAHFSSPSEFVV
jgi:hypothetical protein